MPKNEKPVQDNVYAATLDGNKQELRALVQRNADISNDAEADKRNLADDEMSEIVNNQTRIEELKAQIALKETIKDEQSKIDEPAGTLTGQAKYNAPLQNQATAMPAAVAARLTNVHSATPITSPTMGFKSLGEFVSSARNAFCNGRSAINNMIKSDPGTDGGYAVPPGFIPKIETFMFGNESLMSFTRQEKTDGNGIEFPYSITAQPWVPGGITGYWINEAETITDSAPKIDFEEIKLNKLAVLIPASTEIMEDATYMDTYLNNSVPPVFTYNLNKAILEGTGIKQPLGLLGSTGMLTISPEPAQVASTITLKNIQRMWASMPTIRRSNAIWIMHPQTAIELQNVYFPGDKSPLFIPQGGISATPYATIYNRPVIENEVMPELGAKGDIILADMREYVTLMKRNNSGVRAETSIHVGFTQDLKHFRFILRIGGKPIWKTIFQGTGANKYSPFVTLGERA